MMNDIKELCKKLSVKASFVLSNKDKLELFSKELSKSDIATSTRFNIYDNSPENDSHQSDIRGVTKIIDKLSDYKSFVFKDNLFLFLKESTVYIHTILERDGFNYNSIKQFSLNDEMQEIKIPITSTKSGIGLADGELFDCIRTNLFATDKIHFIISDLERKVYLLFERGSYFYSNIYSRLCKIYNSIIGKISVESKMDIDYSYLLNELKNFTKKSKWDGVRLFGLKYSYLNLSSDDINNLIKDAELEESAKAELNKGINMYKELKNDELNNNVYKIKIELKTIINELMPKLSYNKIFYGVPGVGKSYRIKNGCENDDYEQEKTVFHPEYTNADFVGQLLPVRKENDNGNNSNISYEFVPGPFTRILAKALKNQDDPDKNYMLVIDEINRGNAAAIFGEIFQLLDRDESGKSEFGISNKDIYDYLIEKEGVDKSLLPDEKIYLPSNLYIWATMNTSDQNVYTLDTAFQRRWQMEMLTINFDKDDETKAQGEIQIPNTKNELTWKEFVTAINGKISEKNEGMISVEDKRIGPWFAKKNEIEDKNLFTQKVIKYLWDDAFKMSRTEVFKDVKTLDEIVDKINKGSNIEDIFDEKIFEKVINDRKESLQNGQETNDENEIEDTNE